MRPIDPRRQPKVYEARGRWQEKPLIPIIACGNCGKVIYPLYGQTSIRCQCGRIYNLMAEGKPVRVYPLKEFKNG